MLSSPSHPPASRTPFSLGNILSSCFFQATLLLSARHSLPLRLWLLETSKKTNKKASKQTKKPRKFCRWLLLSNPGQETQRWASSTLGRGRGEGKTKRGNKQIREYSAVYKRDRPKKLSRLAIFQRCLGSQISS